MFLIMFGVLYWFGDYGGMGIGGIEGRFYGLVYLWVNEKDMGVFKDLVLDLIFFVYYVNMDWLWEIWKIFFGKYCKDVIDLDYFNMVFIFFDEDGD